MNSGVFRATLDLKFNPTTSNRVVVDMKWKGRVMINPLEIITSAYEPTPEVKEAAKRVILAFDPSAVDVLEMLGLNE